MGNCCHGGGSKGRGKYISLIQSSQIAVVAAGLLKMQGRVGGRWRKKPLVFSPFAHDFDFPGFSLLPVKRVGSGEESQKEEEASAEFSPPATSILPEEKGKKICCPYALSLSHTHTFEKEAFTPSRDFFSQSKDTCATQRIFFPSVCSDSVLAVGNRKRN